MDVKSKPKEEKYSNEVRHDHQQGVSFGIVNLDSSTAYEGFGTVVDSSSLSRKESMDESYDDEDSNSIGAASEGMHRLATEFDPLSMFGEEKTFLTMLHLWAFWTPLLSFLLLARLVLAQFWLRNSHR